LVLAGCKAVNFGVLPLRRVVFYGWLGFAVQRCKAGVLPWVFCGRFSAGFRFSRVVLDWLFRLFPRLWVVGFPLQIGSAIPRLFSLSCWVIDVATLNRTLFYKIPEKP
jgi:hypothetical protein